MPERALWQRLARGLAFVAVLLWSGAPIALVLLASLKPSREIFEFPPRLIFSPTWENYVGLWERWPAFFEGLVNSLIISAGATALTVVAATSAAYVYSRYRNPLLASSAFFMIVVRMLPPIIITLPLFPLVNALGLNDTHFVLIVLYATFFVSLNTWIMKAFVDQVPREIDESGTMDGAGLFHVLTRLVVPLAMHGVIATTIFVFIFSWNEYLFALIFTTVNTKTAPLVISEMLGALDGVEWGVLFAGTMVQLVPVLVFVMALQRYVVSGLTLGAIKG